MMDKEELLSFEGRISELSEPDKKEAITFYKSLISCYSVEDKRSIFDASADGIDSKYADFILANLSRRVYQKNKSKYDHKVKEFIKTR